MKAISFIEKLPFRPYLLFLNRSNRDTTVYYRLIFCKFSWPNMVKWRNSGIINSYTFMWVLNWISHIKVMHCSNWNLNIPHPRKPRALLSVPGECGIWQVQPPRCAEFHLCLGRAGSGELNWKCKVSNDFSFWQRSALTAVKEEI